MEIENKLNMSLDDLMVGEPRGGGAGGGRGGRGQKRRPRENNDGDGTIRVGRRVYVGNLSWKTTWQVLKDHFRNCGTVVYADVMREGGGETGRSRGCGIVEFDQAEEAAAAINTLNDVELDGRPLFVREDREDRDLTGETGGSRPPRPAREQQQQPQHQQQYQPQQQQHQQQYQPQQQQQNFAGSQRGTSPKRSRPARGLPQQGQVVGVGRRVYVMNLSWDTTWQTLKDHFRQVGNVVYTECMTEQGGRSKGCGIVEFEYAEDALKAISALSNSELDGRSILVREDREDRDLRGGSGGSGGAPPPRGGGRNDDRGDRGGGRPDGGRNAGGGGRGGGGDSAISALGSQGNTVMVQNLPWSVTWQGLKDMFRAAGNVTRSDVAMDNSQRSKGWGTVTFDNSSEAANAIQMFNGSELEGREIVTRMYT
jgi:RNA recognition motif-containing protein